MRKVATVVIPWLVWGALDQLIYLGLLSASPDSFGDDNLPTSAGLLGFLLALRAFYSIVAGYIAAKIAHERDGTRPAPAPVMTGQVRCRTPRTTCGGIHSHAAAGSPVGDSRVPITTLDRGGRAA